MNNLLKITLIGFLACSSLTSFASQTSATVNDDKTIALAKENPSYIVKNDVVVTIAGQAITEKEIADNFDKKMQEGYKYADLPIETRNEILKNYIARILLLKEAKKQKVEDSEDFKKTLAAISEELSMKLVIDSYLTNKILAEDVKKKYDAAVLAAKDSFDVKFSFIQVANKKEADDVVKKLKEKQSFTTLAKKHSLHTESKDNGGSIKNFIPAQSIPAFETTLLKLKRGESSNPINMDNSWYVIKLDDKKPTELPGYDQMKPMIEGELRDIELRKLINSLIVEYNVVYPKPASDKETLPLENK